MPNPVKIAFLAEIKQRFGNVRKLGNSESLFEVGESKTLLYFRYSKRHPNGRTFFGIRSVDLKVLEGHSAVLCFFWDGQREPLFVPFHEFEEVFAALTPSSDGQFKAQVYEQTQGTELYVANAGRFNVDSYIGWEYLDSLVRKSKTVIPELSHTQVQTLLGSIGAAKNFDIWIPSNDRGRLDWNVAPSFRMLSALPSALTPIKEIAEEIDVIWVPPGANQPTALYEVEHSTPIYSGLLRFNDVHLSIANGSMRFGIVSNEDRRGLFVRQLERPTFKASGLRDNCSFFEYANVFGWHERLRHGGSDHEE